MIAMNEELQERIEKLRDQYDDLLDDLSMSDVSGELSRVAATIAGIPGKVQAIRDQGYAYANYLENKAETLNTQWASVQHEVRAGIRREFFNAQNEMRQLEGLWDELDDMAAGGSGSISPARSGKSLQSMLAEAAAEEDDGGMFGKLQTMKAEKGAGKSSLKSALSAAMGSDAAIESLVDRLDHEMDQAEDFVRRAKDRIKKLYGNVPNNAAQTLKQIADIEGYLERAAQANFEFLAAEDVYMVVKAEWKDTGKKKDDPDGYFYVTSNRILMEQSEKKGGFLGFGGKKEEGLLWETAVGTLDNVSFEKKGMLGGIDLIHLQFGSGGPFTETTIEVKGGVDAKWFASRLKQAATGEIEKERGLERDQATVEAIADAPTMCPVCGASFAEEIVRGQTTLTCEYCGSAVRLDV